MTSRLAHLRTLAEKATKGPWKDGVNPDASLSWDARLLTNTNEEIGRIHLNDDRAYIAALSPDTVLALLDRLAAAEGAMDTGARGWTEALTAGVVTEDDPVLVAFRQYANQHRAALARVEEVK